MSTKRIWLGPDESYIPDACQWANHGDEVELPNAPDKDDPRFATEAAAKKHTAPEEN